MKRNQPTLKLVAGRDLEGDSIGYKSGRSRCRETPLMDSMVSTNSAGTFERAIHVDTVLCRPTRNARAKAVCPPTALHASKIAARTASFDMAAITAQTGIAVNADTGNCPSDNAGMGKKAQMPASAFWIRLAESLPQSWRPVNPNSVATKLGMSQGSVYRWFTGEGLPELSTALQLAKTSGVCVDWLLNNTKPRYPISKDPILRELFEVCEDLDEDARERIIRMARGELLQKQGEKREDNIHIAATRSAR